MGEFPETLPERISGYGLTLIKASALFFVLAAIASIAASFFAPEVSRHLTIALPFVLVGIVASGAILIAPLPFVLHRDGEMKKANSELCKHPRWRKLTASTHGLRASSFLLTIVHLVCVATLSSILVVASFWAILASAQQLFGSNSDLLEGLTANKLMPWATAAFSALVAGLFSFWARDHVEQRLRNLRSEFIQIAASNTDTDPGFALYLRSFNTQGQFKRAGVHTMIWRWFKVAYGMLFFPLVAYEVASTELGFRYFRGKMTFWDAMGQSAAPAWLNFLFASFDVATTHSSELRNTRSSVGELEKVLQEDFEGVLPVVALGRPSGHLGVGVVPTEDTAWRSIAEVLIAKSRLILFLPDNTPGTLWEIELIVRLGLNNKVMYFMPPSTLSLKSRPDYEAEWNGLRKSVATLGLQFPMYADRGAIFYLDAETGSVAHQWAFEYGQRRDLMKKATLVLSAPNR